MQRQSPIREKTKMSFKNSKSLTEQCHKDEVKIQNILGRYRRGLPIPPSGRQPFYADMVGAPDFYEAQRFLAETASMFEEVPAQVRAYFGNDPGKYLAFISNPDNAEQMKEFGIDSSHVENPPQPLTHAEFQHDIIDAINNATASESSSQQEGEEVKAT